MNTSTSHGRRMLSVLTLVLAVMVGLAGCAGSSGMDAPSSGDTSPATLTDTSASSQNVSGEGTPTISPPETSAESTPTTSEPPPTTATPTETSDDVVATTMSPGAANDSATQTTTDEPATSAPSTGESDDLPHTDSDYDVAHSRTIESNGDGTTTIRGEVVSVDDDHAVDDLVVTVEVYDDEGDWLASEWVEVGTVTAERKPYSVTVDVPRDRIADYSVDVNGIDRHEGDEHHHVAGQCPEIDGDGPNDEEAEPIGYDLVETDDGAIVVGDVHNGANHEMALVRVFVSVYDQSDDRLATRTVLLEAIPSGDRQRFAVPFDEPDVADARIDADELGIRDGRLTCRPPH